MVTEVEERIARMYAAVGAVQETDPKKLRARVVETPKFRMLEADFRGGLNDEELANSAYSLVNNIASLRDHVRRWARKNGRDKAEVNAFIDTSMDILIMRDLANNDKHGYEPNGRSYSGKNPRLIEVERVLQLSTRAEKGSRIGMTFAADGTPRFLGDGSAKAVITGRVIDNEGNTIGDLSKIADQAVADWEKFLVDFGVVEVQSES